MKLRSRVLWSLAAGSLGALAVLLGLLFDLRGFSPSTGYWGAGWMNSSLYALGDWRAVALVAATWFNYGFDAAFIFLSVTGLGVRGPERSSR